MNDPNRSSESQPRRRPPKHLTVGVIRDRLASLSQEEDSAKIDHLQAQREANTELKPVVEKIVNHIFEIVKSSDTERMKEFLFSLIDRMPGFSKLFEVIVKPKENFVELEYHLGKKDYAKLYSDLVKDSHYDYFRRKPNITIDIFSVELLREILEKIDDDKIKNNIIRSVMLVIAEELAHFLQFNRSDNKENPFLSQEMSTWTFNTTQEEYNQSLIEADITFYFTENSIVIDDSYWLEYHRQQYGDEQIYKKKND